MKLDPIRFIKMQIFDYITLNTDRNRDNYGILCEHGVLKSLYPIFDHDSCFNGKSTKVIYFPSGSSFEKTLNFIKQEYSFVYYNLLGNQIDFFKAYLTSKDFKALFLKFKTLEEYEEMLSRAANL